MLKLENITKIFNRGTIDESCVLKDFDFSVKQNDFVSVIGSNGSGKTTLLNLICGSVTPDSGNVYFKDNCITSMSEHKRARFIGRVFQDPKIGTCAGLTILENMALADNKSGHFNLAMGVNKKRVSYYRELLERCHMGLENRLSACVGTLSGGQRQALALIIANMTDIELLILDEHTAALDPKSSETVMQLTNDIIGSRSITTVMVTHNLRFALEYGNRLVMMHEGKCILDISGKEKQNAKVDDILRIFNDISICYGN